MYTQQEAEGKRLKNPFDTITEGIGINRQTVNFSKAQIDGAFKGTDTEAVEMVGQAHTASVMSHTISALPCVGLGVPTITDACRHAHTLVAWHK